MAGGLKLETERFGAFRDAFTEYANHRLTARDMIPRLRLDAMVSLIELDNNLVRNLVHLGPFGIGNPKPKLASDWLEIDGEPRRVGKRGDHVAFSVREGPHVRRAIAFGQGEQYQQLLDHRRCKLAFEPSLNHYRGFESVELHVVDMQFPE